MRIFVTGGSSGIGSAFARLGVDRGYETVYTYLNHHISIEGADCIKLDITGRKSVLDAIKAAKPDVLVHAASAPGADVCETNPGLADAINVEGTRNVADACTAVNAAIAFISSAFVFDGRRQIYHEEDETNPVNYYGKTKVEGEKIIMQSGFPYIIARTNQLYGWTQKGQKVNSVVRALQKLQKGEECREPADWFNNPTLSDNLAEVVMALVKKGKSGIYHTVGRNYTNRYEWVRMIAKVFGFDENLVVPVSGEEFNLPAKRPNVNLDNSKAEKDSGLRLVGVEEGARIMKETEQT